MITPLKRKFEKLLPKLKTREAEVRYIEKIAEGVWTTHQKSFPGRLPSSVPKWHELSKPQKLPMMIAVENILLQLQKMRVRF